MGLQLDLMPLEEKLPEAPAPKTIVVKYGFMKEIGEFPSDLTSKVGCGSKLILRTDRGTEIGEMLTTVCGNGGCSKSITREKMLDYIEKSGGKDYPFSEAGRVLRVATVQDLAEQSKLNENRRKHIDLARELVQRYVKYRWIRVENLLRPISVMHVEIDDRDALAAAGSSVRCCHGHVVQQAESHRSVGARVMTRRTNQRDAALCRPVEQRIGQH